MKIMVQQNWNASSSTIAFGSTKLCATLHVQSTRPQMIQHSCKCWTLHISSRIRSLEHFSNISLKQNASPIQSTPRVWSQVLFHHRGKYIHIHRLESNTIDSSIKFTQPNRPYLPILTHVWVHCIELKTRNSKSGIL